MPSKYTFLSGSINFSQTSKPKKQIAIQLFTAMIQELKNAYALSLRAGAQNDFAKEAQPIATETAAYFNVSELAEEDFTLLFNDLIPWLNSTLFDLARPHFPAFCKGLTPNKQKALPEPLKIQGNITALNIIPSISSNPQPNQASNEESSNVDTKVVMIALPPHLKEVSQLIERSIPIYKSGESRTEQSIDIVEKYAKTNPVILQDLLSPSIVKQWMLSTEESSRLALASILTEIYSEMRHEPIKEEDWIQEWKNMPPLDEILGHHLTFQIGEALLDRIENLYCELVQYSDDSDPTDPISEVAMSERRDFINFQCALFLRAMPQTILDTLIQKKAVHWQAQVRYAHASIISYLWCSLNTNEKRLAFFNASVPDSSKNKFVIEQFLFKGDTNSETCSSEDPIQNIGELLNYLHNANYDEDILDTVLSQVDWNNIASDPISTNFIFACIQNVKRDNFIISMPLLWGHFENYLEHKANDTLLELKNSNKELPITKQENIENPNYNPSYWYSTDDINEVLKHETEIRNRSDVFALPPVPFEDIEGLIEMLRSSLSDHMTPDSSLSPFTVLLPIQINHNHWIGCVVSIDINNLKAGFTYIDPLSQSEKKDKSVSDALIFAISKALGKGYVVSNSEIETTKEVWCQRDYDSCGPFVIANLIRYGFKEGLDQDAPTAHSLRQRHFEMLNDRFRSRQTNPSTMHSNRQTYMATQNDVLKETRALHASVQIMLDKTNQLPESVRNIYFSFCDAHLSKPDLSIFYPSLRATLISMMEETDTLDALSMSNNEMMSGGTKKQFISLLQTIFIKTADLNLESDLETLILNHSFTDDLPNILTTLSQLRTQGIDNKIASNEPVKLSAESISHSQPEISVHQNTPDILGLLQKAHPVNQDTIEEQQAMKNWQHMLESNKKLATMQKRPTIDDEMEREIAILYRSAEALCSSKYLTKILMSEDAKKELLGKSETSFRLIGILYKSSSEIVKKQLAKSLSEDPIYYRIIEDFWTVDDRGSYQAFPFEEASSKETQSLSSAELFLHHITTRDPEQNMRYGIRLFAMLDVKEINKLLSDRRFNWALVVPCNEVMDLILPVMIIRNLESDDGLRTSPDVSNAIRLSWNAYCSAKRNHTYNNFTPNTYGFYSTVNPVNQSAIDLASLANAIKDLHSEARELLMQFVLNTTTNAEQQPDSFKEALMETLELEAALASGENIEDNGDIVKPKIAAVLKQLLLNFDEKKTVPDMLEMLAVNNLKPDALKNLKLAVQSNQSFLAQSPKP